MKFTYRARSEAGPVRPHNEDYVVVSEAPSDEAPGALYIVCDGRGGPQVGEVAAQMAADTINMTYYAATESDPEQALCEAFQAANQRVHQHFGFSTTRVTAVAALLVEGQVIIASVGDCRAYHYRDGQLQQITHDHTFYDELIRQGMLTRADVQTYSTNITRLRALGDLLAQEVDLFKSDMQPNDALLLCTDGLHGYVEDAEVEDILKSTPPKGAIDRFIDLVYTRGGRDNITALLIWPEE
jgi:serine/threonine protein phosphatase PrpC